jgi:integrase
MAARKGQKLHIIEHGGWKRLRYRIDVPGQHERVYKSDRICPISGPGALEGAELMNTAMKMLIESGCNTPLPLERAEAVSNGDTFRDHARKWLDEVKPDFKPATMESSNYYLDKFLLPEFGDLFLGDVRFRSFKDMVDRMKAQGKPSPKTVHCIVQLGLQIISSVVNDNGEIRFPRLWKTSQLRLPPIRNQHQPELSPEAMQHLVSNSQGQCRVLFALLGGSGLRIGEALALRVEHLSDNCSTVTVSQSVRKGVFQTPKTEAGNRQIDLHSSLAAMLKEFIGERTDGLLFHTASGKPLSTTNIARRHLHPPLTEIGAPRAGLHSFRRFRVTHLDTVDVPRMLTDYWIGHSSRSVTDRYSKIKNRVSYRKEFAEKAGLGFTLEPLGANVAPKPLFICTQEIAEAA